MIWKDYLKLSEIASYSKLPRASKAPPPPPRRNRVNTKLFGPLCKEKYTSKPIKIRDLLEKADKKLFTCRSNDPECPLFPILPRLKNTRYNLRGKSNTHPRIQTDRFKNAFSNRLIFKYSSSF